MSLKRFFPGIAFWLLLAGILHGAAIGEMAPEPDLGPVLKGKKFRLADNRGKTLTVLHFWKPGCPPCAKAIPMINELVKLYQGKVSFLAIGAGLPSELRKELLWKTFQFPVAADNFHQTADLYLPKDRQFPADAVIGKDGRLLWCGPSVMLAGALGEIMEGKYDLASAVALDRFNREMQNAMEKKDYQKALQTLRARRKAAPDDFMLAVGEANILAGNCKKTDEALAVLDREIARKPQLFMLYQAKMQVLQFTTPPSDKRRLAHYKAMAEAFRTRPQLLVQLASGMMKQRVGTFEILGVYYLAKSAYGSPALQDPIDRGKAAASLARCYYYMGMPERAVIYQAEAVEFLKKTAEARRSVTDLEFYRSALIAAAEVKKLEAEQQNK